MRYEDDEEYKPYLIIPGNPDDRVVFPDELKHYGVKGMKWGIRHDRERSSYRDRKMSKYEDKYRKKNKDNLSDEEIRQKAEKKYIRRRNIKIASGALVAAYAGYKFVDSGTANSAFQKCLRVIDRSDDLFNKKEGLSGNLSSDDIMKNVVSRINPDYGSAGTKNNCRRCTFAYEMSRRGYDVKATRTLKGTGQHGAGLYEATHAGRQSIFHGPISTMNLAIKDIRKATTQENGMINTMGAPLGKTNPFDSLVSSNPDRARGELMMKWSKGGGHSMAYEIIDGSVHVFDCQTGREYDRNSFERLLPHVSELNYTRLDNLHLDTRFLDRWLTNA